MRLVTILHVAGLALLLAPAPRTSAQDENAGGSVTFEVRTVTDRPGPHTRSYLGVQTGTDGKAESILLNDPPLLDSKAIRYVAVDYDAEQHPSILINLTADGTKRFEQITRDMVGREIAFVIGGQLYSITRVGETVHGGKIAINGSFTARQAANLATRLNAALPRQDGGASKPRPATPGNP